MTMDYDIPALLLYALSGDTVSDGYDTGKISDICLELFERDYECEILENENGTLCSTYPSKMFIPLPMKGRCKISKLKDCVMKARFARTRGRFVMPVILLNGKYICRSSTLARSPEIYCRQGYGYWMNGEAAKSSNNLTPETNGEEPAYFNGRGAKLGDPNEEGNEWMVDKMRNADISLLQYLKVNVIFDLMVENKKVKYGMNVTSSEKADKSQRYHPFSLLSVPYPGCEFFAEYKNCNYDAEKLTYDWKQNFVDAILQLPRSVNEICNVAWEDYINWDLATLTKNYLLLHLRLLTHENSSGILLHCISGWDRTPLFISLLRISLWADGLAHESLSACEMAYFTIAYDWLLFQHQFEERVANGEEIFFFCFDFLKHIVGDEFSLSQNQCNEESTFTNGNSDIRITSNGDSPNQKQGEEIDLLVHCDTSNGHAILEQNEKPLTSVATSNEIEKSYLSQYCDAGPCNDDRNQSAVLPVQQTGEAENGHISGDPISVSYRQIKLMELRKLVIDGYKETIDLLNEREQTKNVGIAATLMKHITRTFSLVKK